MRGLIWVLLLFVVAVVAATTLGRNDGLVSLYWGSWRTDLSLNLFVLLLLGACAALMLAVQAINRVVSLPKRAGEWRALRKERAAHAALREAQVELYAARYSRARRAAQRALALQAGTPELESAQDFKALGLLLLAHSAQRLQDGAARQQALQGAAAASAQRGGGGSLDDGVQLLTAEWALENREAPQALQALGALSAGAARRTQALRLRLQANRAERQPLQALQVARLLANHQAFSPLAARSLLRTLAGEALEQARDAEQLRRIWSEVDASERADPAIVAKAAAKAHELGAQGDARGWLRPLWERLAELEPEDRQAVAQALFDSAQGISGDWLPSLERNAQAFGREATVAAAVGACYAHIGLYGKARVQLEHAAACTEANELAPRLRRAALRQLADLARREGDEPRALAHERVAAAVE
jgi:HemY protein